MLTYLASPYSHPDADIREENFVKISKVASKMIAEGLSVISPITYGHTLLKYHKLPEDWEFWQNFCFQILIKCDKLIVCKMEGWDKSKGVAEEISIARDHGIPVEYIEYSE
jgi:hypothetical protein